MLLSSNQGPVKLVVCACRLQNGTTYNSFLIFGEDKTALVDASHEKFRELYIGTLKEQLKAAGRKIDYVFVSHTEPDHSGMHPYTSFLCHVSAFNHFWLTAHWTYKLS